MHYATSEEIVSAIQQIDNTFKLKFVVRNNIIRPSEATKVFYTVVNDLEGSETTFRLNYPNGKIIRWQVDSLENAKDILDSVGESFDHSTEKDFRNVSDKYPVFIVFCLVPTFG